MTKHLKVLPVPTDKYRTANRLASSGQSALVTAVEHGYDECLEPLVIARDDVNETDELHVSVLMKAVLYNKVQCVDTLTKLGADVNATNMYGDTSLCYAVKYGYNRCVELLIQAGADVNVTQHIPSSNIRIPLLVQVAYRVDGCLIRLVGAGANVNMCLSYGRTAVMGATSAMNLRNVKLLLKSGAHVNKIIFFNHNAIQQHLSHHGPSCKDISITLFAAGGDHRWSHC